MTFVCSIFEGFRPQGPVLSGARRFEIRESGFRTGYYKFSVIVVGGSFRAFVEFWIVQIPDH